MSGGSWLAVIILVALLGASAATAYWVWVQMSDVPMSTHGFIALGLGCVVAIGLGVGLMSLVWRSHDRGYDDQVR
jgi:hypothetical protein